MQKGENIQVAVRFRPSKKDEKKNGTFFLKVSPDDNSIEISENSKEIQKFNFDYVFDEKTTQEQIFTRIAKNAIEWVTQGYNATIFAYGTTGTGKSHTMFGGDTEKSLGIIPRACNLLFQQINSNDDVVEANMKCAFLEIYREHIRDLLQKSDEKELKVRHSPVSGVYIQGLTEKYVYGPDEILSTIREGTQLRTTASTALNSVSSRSHAVLTLTLTQKNSDGSETISKLHLIDLAGSENVAKSEAQGVNLIEAQTINKSLSCLGNVICALTEKGREHIPYRDSKLTYILQDSLGGNAKTILIATASQLASSYFDTISTLKFARRVKEIKNSPKINKNESVANLLQIIEGLNKRIQELETICVDSKAIITAVGDSSNQEENKENIVLKTTCQQLEKRIAFLEELRKKDEERNREMDDLYDTQRDLACATARNLYEERLRNAYLINEVENFKLLFDSVTDCKNTPHLIPFILERYCKMIGYIGYIG